MEMQKRTTMATVDRLSDLPDSILIHILSLLSNEKQVVRTSLLSRRWRFLWMSVPVSLGFSAPPSDSELDIVNFIASIHRDLYYWRSCQKIQKIWIYSVRYEERYVKDVDLWVHFATKVANVEEFTLGLHTRWPITPTYEFPQFAYKNTSLRNLALFGCLLNPSGIVNWTNLVSLSFSSMNLTDASMEKVLSGCPNLECLALNLCDGIHRLEITSVKLRKLRIQDHVDENLAFSLGLEIFAPNLQELHLSGDCNEIRIRQRMASLVTADLCLNVIFRFHDGEGNLEKKCRYWKELIHSVAHVKNLELGHWCIEFLSILELRGWQPPPSSRKLLELTGVLEQLDFPGICSFLQSSPDLETLVFDWYRHEPKRLLSKNTNEDEQSRRFETHYFNCSLLHLKTIKIRELSGPLSENNFLLQLVKYLLRNATVLEKLIIEARFEGSDVEASFEGSDVEASFEGSDVAWEYVAFAQEFLRFPRSSPHASIVFG